MIQRGLNFTLTTDLGALDLFGEIPGGGGYEDLQHDAIEIKLFGVACRCLSLKRLIEVKRAAGRPRAGSPRAAVACAARFGGLRMRRWFILSAIGRKSLVC